MSEALAPSPDPPRPPRLLLAGLGAVEGSEVCSALPPDWKVEVLERERITPLWLPDDAAFCDALLLDSSAFPSAERARCVRSALTRLFQGEAHAQAIVLVPEDDPETMRAAAAAGARDVIDPQEGAAAIAAQLRAATRMRRLFDERAASARPPTSEALDQMIGASPRMRRSTGLIRRVAATEISVLLNGESGTGKELAARAIHELGPRRTGPFVPINCAAIPDTLLESELFGHERGAFTGAGRTRQGRVELANGGTLFLDEVGELAPPLQAKLLRFLEDHLVERIGGKRAIPIDVRVVAATNRDLAAEVVAGRFREDLYYRLAVLEITLPPLRERGDDVLLLARHFLRRYGHTGGDATRGFASEALAAMRDAPWPGNVRELMNRVRQAIVIADGEQISAADLGLATPDPPPPPPPKTLREARERAEIECIRGALEECGWNKTEAARRLGVSRTRLYEILRRIGPLTVR